MEIHPQYKDKLTRNFANGERVRVFQSIEKQLKKRLLILENAKTIQDLILLPSNHFEALTANRKGSFSIRINQQWRLCFEWSESQSKAYNIEIVDYH